MTHRIELNDVECVLVKGALERAIPSLNNPLNINMAKRVIERIDQVVLKDLKGRFKSESV